MQENRREIKLLAIAATEYGEFSRLNCALSDQCVIYVAVNELGVVDYRPEHFSI